MSANGNNVPSLAKIILVAAITTLFLTEKHGLSQDTLPKSRHFISVKTQFHQLKDEFNYGLVFNGALLDVEYQFIKPYPKGVMRFESEVGFGPSYKIGVGLCWVFKPVDFQYAFRIKTSPFYLGPYTSLNYNWQLYPELQSGHMFWNSSFELGSVLIYKTSFKERPLMLSLTAGITGLNSRPEIGTETYHYSLRFSDFFRNAHSNMEFLFTQSFSHSLFNVFLQGKKKLSYGYTFEYFGRYVASEFRYFNHSFNLIWNIRVK